MSDPLLQRTCLGDAELAEKIAALSRDELEMLTASLAVIGRKLGHRPQLGAYARKICERAQSTLLTSLTPLDEVLLQLIEECVEQGDSGAAGD